MTPSTLRLLGIAGAIVALAGLTWIGLGYRRDRGPLVERIDKIRGYVADARAEQRRHDVVLEDLQALAEHTLGGDRETVDHRLRSHLNRLGEAIGLSGLSVNTSRYAARSSPARAAFTARAERQVRDEVDFVEVEATVSGEGTLEQVLQMVHQVQRQPWPKRIDQLRLNPRDNGARFDVTLRLTTLFMPDLSPAEPRDPLPLADGLERYAPLIAANPFRLPPPPAPSEPTPAIAQTDPPPAPAPLTRWREWAVTGVVEGPAGPEVWLLNTRSRETLRLAVGEQIEQLELVVAVGDTARFRDGERLFVVRVGATMADREAIGADPGVPGSSPGQPRGPA